MIFEWDERKAAANLSKHRVAFEDATAAFNDRFALHIADRSMRYDEARYICLGLADGIIYFVVYTEREEVVRLISARRATRTEQSEYDRERFR